MRMTSSIAALASLVLVASCTEPVEDRPDPEETMMPVEPNGGIGDGATPLPELLGTTIPEALHGRWGLVPADCTSTRGDAKGLITIDAERIEFYESRAVVDEIEEQDPGMIRARFAFTGEGQEWTRDIEWRLSEGGATLTRSESGEDALEEPLSYTKCETEGE